MTQMQKELAVKQYKEAYRGEKVEGYVPKAAKAKAKRKGSGVGKFILVLLLFCTAAGAVIVMDVGGLRTKLVGMVSVTEQLSPEESILEDKNARADSRLEQLEIAQQNLNDYESMLKDVESSLAVKMDETQRKSAEIDAVQSVMSAKYSDISMLAELYSSMDAMSAADVLSAMSDTDKVVVILKNLDTSKAAKILAMMPPDKAADLTTKLYPQ